MEFCNSPDDVQWLKDTALKGCEGIPEFKSFVLYGNEAAPYRIDLYMSADPLYADRHMRVTFDCESPVYCVCEWCEWEKAK